MNYSQGDLESPPENHLVVKLKATVPACRAWMGPKRTQAQWIP